MRIDCQLAALDSKLLVVHAGTDTVEWYPREQTLPERPVALPLPITITDVRRKDEDFRGDVDYPCVRVNLLPSWDRMIAVIQCIVVR